MVELLVLADDFTGAIDTGVQFAQQSVPTLVSNRFQQLDQGAIQDFSVFVIDIESRHIPPKEAESRVIETVELALDNGIRSFYKKTDSTLRGNIGSELSALLEAAGASVLAFIPAYPKNGRTTVAGTQFVNGVLLHRSSYSMDLQNPVRTSYIPDIIAAQTPIPVRVVEHAESMQFECNSAAGKRIIVFDARTDEDLRSIANHLKRLGFLQVSAGCAGFAEYLPEMLCLKRGVIRAIDCPTQLIIVCGSINPVSLKQIEVAVQGGVERIVLQPEQLLRIATVFHDGSSNDKAPRCEGLIAAKNNRGRIRTFSCCKVFHQFREVKAALSVPLRWWIWGCRRSQKPRFLCQRGRCQ
jgi:uncharacterized protein YgbK (DUF1537 family)